MQRVTHTCVTHMSMQCVRCVVLSVRDSSKCAVRDLYVCDSYEYALCEVRGLYQFVTHISVQCVTRMCVTHMSMHCVRCVVYISS